MTSPRRSEKSKEESDGPPPTIVICLPLAFDAPELGAPRFADDRLNRFRPKLLDSPLAVKDFKGAIIYKSFRDFFTAGVVLTFDRDAAP